MDVSDSAGIKVSTANLVHLLLVDELTFSPHLADTSRRCIQARKPYTISKQRERWTEEEHGKFLDGLRLFGRAWRKIEGEFTPNKLSCVPPRTDCRVSRG